MKITEYVHQLDILFLCWIVAIWILFIYYYVNLGQYRAYFGFVSCVFFILLEIVFLMGRVNIAVYEDYNYVHLGLKISELWKAPWSHGTCS